MGEIFGEVFGEVGGELLGEVGGEVGGEVAGEAAGELEGEVAGEVEGETSSELRDTLERSEGDDIDDSQRAQQQETRRASTRVRVSIQKQDNFKGFRQQIDAACIKGLEQVGRQVLARAKSNETRQETGRLNSSLKLSPVYRTKRGFAIEVYSSDPNALWQERGTHARRGRAKTQRTRTKRAAQGITHGGVKPLRFMKRATSGAAGKLVDEIRSAMR